MGDIELLKLLLPEYLVAYFTVTRYSKEDGRLHLYFEEKNSPPPEYFHDRISSKGFYDEIVVQDFPIRGQSAYLHIRRRKWMNYTTDKVVSRDWELVAKGTRMTAEFAAFLKELSRF